MLGNQRCTLAVRGLDPRKRKLHESRDRVLLRRDDLQLGHGLAVPPMMTPGRLPVANLNLKVGYMSGYQGVRIPHERYCQLEMLAFGSTSTFEHLEARLL